MTIKNVLTVTALGVVMFVNRHQQDNSRHMSS